MLTVRLLGEVAVTVDGSPAPQMIGRQQALIARLALAEARPVPVDQLIEDLWNGRPPSSAANALQVLVSGVRKLLTTRAIRTAGRTYAIDKETRIDVVEYESRAFGREQSLRPKTTSMPIPCCKTRWVCGPEASLRAWKDSTLSMLIEFAWRPCTSTVSKPGRRGKSSKARAVRSSPLSTTW